KLTGLTVTEANQIMQDHVDMYLNNATVQLRLINFKVSLLGEVNKPGTYYIYQPSVNILELVSNAGDMTPYGNRQEVMLVRTVNGEERSVFLDLTNRNVLESPFFYLQPGDVVYVQPNRVSKTTGFATIPWGTIFSAISSTILIINFLQ
ncbi:MAG: polysaccharide biosynthesis/export family protein, partial [Bacteroidales bacterium]